MLNSNQDIGIDDTPETTNKIGPRWVLPNVYRHTPPEVKLISIIKLKTDHPFIPFQPINTNFAVHLFDGTTSSLKINNPSLFYKNPLL